jgi:hypothetical protein
LGAVDDEAVDGCLRLYEFEAELLLNGGEEIGRAVRLGLGRGTRLNQEKSVFAVAWAPVGMP